MKTCPRCLENKELALFYSRGKYTSPYCKLCTSTYNKARRADGYRPPISATMNSAYNTRKSWLSMLAKRGLTEQDYLRMVNDQNGSCAICPTTVPWSRSDKWHVDHDHRTGKVRGLLCINCNRGLGLFQDKVDLLQKAIKYLENQ